MHESVTTSHGLMFIPSFMNIFQFGQSFKNYRHIDVMCFSYKIRKVE
jgi:hypothetical protein